MDSYGVKMDCKDLKVRLRVMKGPDLYVQEKCQAWMSNVSEQGERGIGVYTLYA